jgi:hypothetical protein
MSALAPIPTYLLKAILELDGFKVAAEDSLNWVLVKEVGEVLPIIIPKVGKLVAVDLLMGALHKAQMNDARYFELLELAKAARGSIAPSSTRIN